MGRSRGGLATQIHGLVDGAGRPMVVLAGPGQTGNAPMFGHLMAHLQADKAYSSRAIRAHLRSRGIIAMIAEKVDQAGHRVRRGYQGGRPSSFDPEDYMGRNVVERSFNVFKQWRGLATRYDKLALTYRGGTVLRTITIWLKDLLGDMP